VDDLHLLGGQSDALDLEACECLRDRDDLLRTPCERALDVTERAGAERIVVVLRRHESPRSERAVDVCMDEMCVHEVGLARQPADREREPRVEVARGGKSLVRDGQCVVERVGCARRVVETEEAHVDAELGKRRQQCQQMPFGPADAADAVDVDDLHVRGRRRVSTHCNAAAASSAIRKSVETR
jgi:hypothetical protein